MHFLAEQSFRPDAKAVSDQQHADQKFRIDRRAARVAVEIRQMGANAAQVNETINGSQQVILWDMIFQRKLLKKCRLRFLPRSQH